MPPLPKISLPLIDSLRYSSLLRHAAGILSSWKGRAAREPEARVRQLCHALTMLEGASAKKEARGFLAESVGFDDPQPWEKAVRATPRYARMLRDDPMLTRTIVLKAPGPAGEKGVLLAYFEYNWVRLLLGLDEAERRWLDENYDLVLSTSWSCTDYAALGLAVSALKSPLWVQCSNFKEVADIEALHPRLRCTQSLQSDWIDPGFHHPKPPEERVTDILMVANWGEFKRHWEFFQALSHLPADLKVVLIGQKEGGRTADTIRALARTYGVPQQLEIHESLPVEEVARHQERAKISLILSRREGACVVGVESLFAGCALAMRADAHVGSAAYINEHTGMLLRPGHIHQDLMALLQAAPRLRPRDWAVENISCQVTHAKLNEQLRGSAESRGLPWTQDLALAQWRPYPVHAHEHDRERLRPAYAELHRRFPKVFSVDLIDTSRR